MGFNLKQLFSLLTSPSWRTEEYTDSELEEMMNAGDQEAAQQQETQNANSWEKEPAADDSGWVADPGLGLNDSAPTWSQPDDSGSNIYSNTGLNDFTSQEVSLDTQAYSDYVRRLKDEAAAKASAMAAEYAASQAETSGGVGIDWESYQNNGLNDSAPTSSQPDNSGSGVYSDTGLNDFTSQEVSLDTQAYADYVQRLKDEAAAKRSALEEEYAASQAEASGGAGIDWESYQNSGLNDFTPTGPYLPYNPLMKNRITSGGDASGTIANIRDSQYNGAEETGKGTDNGTGNQEDSYLKKSLDQVLLGNYTDDVTLLGTAGQVGLGLAGLDLPADIRDLTYDLSHWKWTPGHVGQTLLDTVGLLPVVGGIKYMDEAGALAKGMAKNADEAGALTKGILKYGDEAAEVADDAVKTAIKGVDEAGEAVKDGAKIADEVVTEGAGDFEIPKPPKSASLSDTETRRWYLDAEAKIPDLIDRTKPLEQQAKQAFEFRNQFRTQARNAMTNKAGAEGLFGSRPNMTWEQIVNKYARRGYSGDALYQEIIKASQRSNADVNNLLAVFPK